jgi:hypothetical protein
VKEDYQAGEYLEETVLSMFVRIVLLLVVFAILFYVWYGMSSEETQDERIRRVLAGEQEKIAQMRNRW